jgi:ubiquinone/menaquinone biosynthesis C-methylase UbiE
MVSEFLDPKLIIKRHLKTRVSMVAADFGCGSGGWAIPLAQILKEGKVYAIDLLEEPLSVLRSKIRTNNIFNIEVVKADVEKTIIRLLANSADIVLMTNLLFQVKNKPVVVTEAARVLRPGGKLLVIDWNKDSAIGPDKRIGEQEVKDLADRAGFKLIEEFEAGSQHFGLVFEKK